MRYRVVVVVVLIAVGLTVGPVLASAVIGPSTSTADHASTSESDLVANTTTNGSDSPTDGSSTPSLGSKMSAFMQSSTISAEAAVENGMWKAGITRANASAQRVAVERRTGSLEQRLRQLEARLAAVENESVDVRNPDAAATVSRLAARIQALERAMNETGETARSIGVNTTRLDALRSEASKLRGHEVASMARNLSGGPPAEIPGGPPAEALGPSNESAGNGPTDGGGKTPPGASDTSPPGASDTSPPGASETASKPDDSGTDRPGRNEEMTKQPTERGDGTERTTTSPNSLSQMDATAAFEWSRGSNL